MSGKEHGLLFSAPMVLAQLDVTKTQTRRVVSRSNSLVDGCGASKELWASLDFSKAWIDAGPSPAGNPGPYLKVPCPAQDTVHRVYPRVQVGDRIVCRETWAPADWLHEGYEKDDPTTIAFKADLSAYLVDGYPTHPPVRLDARNWNFDLLKWRVSIHMPRYAARLVHDVTLARPERLQDISEADAMAEGIQGHPFRPDDGFPICTGYMVGKDDGQSALAPTAKDAYRKLWQGINGDESWEANPLVWVFGWAS